MAASDAKPIPQKNVAYRVTFPIYDNDGDLVTGAAALDSEVSKDGGTFADCTNEATEIATSSGIYYLDLTATEMNADTVAVIVKTTTTDAKTTPIVMYPEEAGDIRVNVTQLSGDTTAADNAEAFFDGTGYAGTNNTIPTVTNVTNQVTADVTAISGDTTAANNLEADYDGTGYNKSASTIGTCTTNTDMRGTDSAALASVCTETRLSELDAATAGKMANQVDVIEADTTSLNDTKIPDTISLANINAEVVDVINTDTYAEPGQGAPAATATLAAKINYLYKAWRNKSTQTSTTYSLFDDAGSTVDQKATVSDDGTTATKGEVATGP